jgi:hypothetical protein
MKIAPPNSQFLIPKPFTLHLTPYSLLFPLPSPQLLTRELVLDIFVEERACGAFAFDIELEHLPQPWRNIVVPVQIAAPELDLHRFFLFVVLHPVNGRRLRGKNRLRHGEEDKKIIPEEITVDR